MGESEIQERVSESEIKEESKRECGIKEERERGRDKERRESR